MKNPLKTKSIIALLSLFLALPAQALAQTTSKKTNAASDSERIQVVVSEKDSVPLGGLRARLVFSSLAVGVGTSAAVGMGILAARECGDPDQWFCGIGASMATIGALEAAAGIFGLVRTSKQIKKAKADNAQRNQVELQQAQVRRSVAYGAPQGAAMLRF